MKIAFLLFHWPVLSETFILNQITGLLDRGHDVDTHAKSPGAEPVTHGDIDRYRLRERTFYYGESAHRMPAGKVERVARAARLLAANVWRKPGPLLRSLNVLKYGRMASSLAMFYRVAPFLDADRYDIIHCHFGPNGNRAVLLRDVGATRAKIVTTFHGEAGYTHGKRYRKGFQPLFERGDLLLPMSEREKQDLVRLGGDERKIVVHRMGVDLRRFAFAPRAPGADDVVRVLTVARLAEKKGVAYGIRAVAQALTQHPRIEYDIVGDGPLCDDLRRLIQELGVAGRVRLLGWKPQEEVVELARQAHLFLAPSVTSDDGDQEGIPVVLMEAMAQGLPVISTRHAGIPELVQDGESGFLVPERDADALTDRLVYLAQHSQRWAEMGQAGRRFVEQHHDIDRLNDRLVALYRQLLDGQPVA